MGWPQVLGVTAPEWRQEEINSSLQAEPSPLQRTERYGGRGASGSNSAKTNTTTQSPRNRVSSLLNPQPPLQPK